MIFDTFCGLVERHVPAAIPLLKRAHLFEFPGIPHETLPKQFGDEEAELLSETFFLPFPVVAVEDPISCVVLFDKDEDQQGANTERRFAECLPIDYEHLSKSNKPLSEGEREVLAKYPPGLTQITFGRVLEFHIHGSSQPKPLSIRGEVDRVIVCDKRRVYASDNQIYKTFGANAVAQAVMSNVKTAFEEVFYFNTPNRFVVERETLAVRPHPKHLQIRRSTHRPKYILLTPAEIQDRLGSEGEGPSGRKSPVGHARRRHYRKLTSDRYTNARGKLLCIPATWVGPEESVQDNVRYRVRIDL